MADIPMKEHPLTFSGLYNSVNSKKRFADPQELFTRATFCESPLDFYADVMPIIPKLRTAEEGGRLAKPEDILEYVPRYGLTHAFFSLLDDKSKLRTIYTQNIDGLEKAAGVEASRVINCHGSWDTATCMTCKGKVSANDYLPIVCRGALPLCLCAKPVARDLAVVSSRKMRKRADKQAEQIEYLEAVKAKRKPVGPTASAGDEAVSPVKKRKRADEGETSDPISRPGLLKPDITFFDEAISRAYEPRLLQDATKVDLFLIIGTSLPVEPVNKLPFEIPASVPQIWISREHCQRAGLKVDIELLGDCDLIVEELSRRAGWTRALENRVWRNKYGSRVQAKEQLGKLKKERSLSVDPVQKLEVKSQMMQASVIKEEKEASAAPAVVITGEPQATNIHAISLNNLVIRPSAGIADRDFSGDDRSTTSSTAKPKGPLPPAKVTVEADLAMEWRWYVRCR
jgi:NAD-dependent SIR2 family protein deacetylase